MAILITECGARLEEALPEDGVLVGQQAARDVRVGDLQEPEPRLQGQADALLRQQRPAQSDVTRQMQPYEVVSEV